MTRPDRNRLGVGAFMIACVLLGKFLPVSLQAPFVLTLLLFALSSFIFARDFFAGRRHMKKLRWVDALLAFQRFESQLSNSKTRRRLSWLAAGIYSFDPIAISRNNVGVIHLENRKLELSEAAFKEALRRDALYAVPHINLAVIAALRGKKAEMETELAEAARLGLTQKRVHARVRQAIALGENETRNPS
jgi:hypothetical protein